MGQALYRKYRSKSLDEVVGQEHITTTLEHALKSGRISHAYLFTGPKGVGKTSIARIWAHEINGLPYTDDANHLDIIEIDAASNRRIDEIRDLRDRVYVAPSSSQYKVYIIDEVHMLTKEAFNALLKTLEEPPAHVVFILATTEVHKLPATIISRTQRFIFRPIDQDKVTSHLRTIADSEKITISDDALNLIAQHGEGSFRDSISLLDQAGNQTGQIELATIQRMLGIAPDDIIKQLLEQLTSGDKLALIKQLSQLYDQGYQAGHIANQLSGVLRSSYLLNTAALPPANLLQLLTRLIEVPASAQPDRLLEIILLEASLPSQPETISAAPTLPTPVIVAQKVVTNQEAPSKSVASDPVPVKPTKQKVASGTLDLEQWPTVLSEVKKRYNTLYSVLKTADPTYEDGILKLCFQFAFHQKRINEAKNKQILTDILQQVTGLNINFECTLADKTIISKPKPTVVAPSDEPPLDTINNIFGGSEVLKS